MTAILLLEDAAIARHATAEKREQHEQMGFHEGWGIVLDQLVEYVRGLGGRGSLLVVWVMTRGF